MHLERVKIRADRGGHSAPESLLRRIYDSSVGNLPRAIREMDYIYVYDNSRWGRTPLVLLEAEKDEIQFQAGNIPSWLANV
jgi:predicted ABC-type ATPase